jgi:hypothetical protein
MKRGKSIKKALLINIVSIYIQSQQFNFYEFTSFRMLFINLSILVVRVERQNLLE